MYKRKISVSFFIIMIMSISMIAIFPMSRETTNNPIKTAKFVIASWDFPSDEYGQGIDKVGVFENSTGSWLPLETIEYDEPSECEIYTNASIKLEVWTWQNSTLTGASDWEDGKNYHRHDVNVTSINGTLIFSQQNFTYAYCFPAINPPLWYYGYDVILDFVPVEGEIYTTTIGYDVYYQIPEKSEYLHDGSSLDDITYHDNSNLDAGDYGINANASCVDFWMMPDDFFQEEGVQYKIDFTNIDNTDGNLDITIRYKIELTTHEFYFRVVYDDASKDDSDKGNSYLTWDILELTPDADKTLDYIILYNYDEPNSVNSGNLSVWIDYVMINRTYDYEWHEVAEMALYLQVPYDMWGYNTALIILGLVMIPTSTIYLAYGIKHDRSSDRLFYGLIIFFLGFGLLIGGIMP